MKQNFTPFISQMGLKSVSELQLSNSMFVNFLSWKVESKVRLDGTCSKFYVTQTEWNIMSLLREYTDLFINLKLNNCNIDKNHLDVPKYHFVMKNRAFQMFVDYFPSLIQNEQ